MRDPGPPYPYVSPLIDRPPEPWEEVPHWHWRYWFGWTIRRWEHAYVDSKWQYGRPHSVAHDLLRRQYDPTGNESPQS